MSGRRSSASSIADSAPLKKEADMSLQGINVLTPELRVEIADLVASGKVQTATAKLTLKDGTKRKTTVYLFPDEVERMPEVADYFETAPDPARHVLFAPDFP
jgi:hypothetical protein